MMLLPDFFPPDIVEATLKVARYVAYVFAKAGEAEEHPIERAERHLWEAVFLSRLARADVIRKAMPGMRGQASDQVTSAANIADEAVVSWRSRYVGDDNAAVPQDVTPTN